MRLCSAPHRCSVDMMSRSCALDLSKELIIAVILPRMAAKTMAPVTTMSDAKIFSRMVSGCCKGGGKGMGRGGDAEGSEDQ